MYNYRETLQYDKELGQSGLFSEFKDFYLRIKQEASDYPAWVKSSPDVECAKDVYIEAYKENEGILLDKTKICKNPALDSLAKLLLNSFWGKSQYTFFFQ